MSDGAVAVWIAFAAAFTIVGCAWAIAYAIGKMAENEDKSEDSK